MNVFRAIRTTALTILIGIAPCTAMGAVKVLNWGNMGGTNTWDDVWKGDYATPLFAPLDVTSLESISTGGLFFPSNNYPGYLIASAQFEDGRVQVIARSAPIVGVSTTNPVVFTEYFPVAGRITRLSLGYSGSISGSFREINAGAGTNFVFGLPATLQLNVSKAGTGTVASHGGAINCGVTCSANFARGAVVTLTAIPAAGSAFAGWLGGGCSGTGTCVVTVDAAKTVKAEFAAATLPLNASMVIPLVAQTGSYTSQITVRNPYHDMELPISVFYIGADTTSAAGRRACAPLTVPPLSAVQFSAAGQCDLPIGTQFGYVTLTESASIPSPFQVFSRTQTPGGNGFSVPAYSKADLEDPDFGHYIVGLKRQAAAPTYQSNCFVASTDAATPYTIRLLDSTGKQIGNTIPGSLNAYEMVRYLDIFTAAGIEAGDLSNVSADFYSGTSNAPLIGFCTVQESTFFGADFRMAQP
jgi:hypothetical protein